MIDYMEQDDKDMIILAHTHISIDRCRGGRIIRQGYVCPHCGSVNPKDFCDADKVTDSPLIVEVE